MIEINQKTRGTGVVFCMGSLHPYIVVFLGKGKWGMEQEADNDTNAVSHGIMTNSHRGIRMTDSPVASERMNYGWFTKTGWAALNALSLDSTTSV